MDIAFKAAVEDARVEKNEIGGMLIVDRVYNQQEMFENWYPAAHLKMSTAVCGKMLSGGGSVGLCLNHACYAIMLGIVDVVVVAAVNRETQVTASEHLAYSSRVFDCEFETIHGVTVAGVDGGMSTQRYLFDYKVPQELIAEIPVKCRLHASMNPIARFQAPLVTVDDVMGSKLIADPCHLLECASRDDGAAVIVLANEERTKRGPHPPIWIKGLGEWHEAASFISDNLTELPAMRLASQKALQMAGVGVKDISLFELYTPFAVMEALAIEELGLAPRGQGAYLVRDKMTHFDGPHPINVSGGLLSRGHPVYATQLYNIIEVIIQLRNQAGARQVKDAKLGLTTGVHSAANGVYAAVFERA
ncbi:MAG: thiolase family protein [Thermodesulfobacteriota bacterium]